VNARHARRFAGAALFMFALVASGAGDEGFNFGPHLGDMLSLWNN
jgi:fructose-1,6-bisphosphatase/inositol monophosphatase family enzyme